VTEALETATLEADPVSSTGERRIVNSNRAAASDPYIGRIIDGRYLVETVIGEGGMGVIYQCRHRIIGKKLAIKIIRREVARAPETPKRFLIEARAASAIGSEHIIHVSDFGRLPDGAAYLVMEFLEGASLAQVIQSRTPMPIRRVVSIGIQLAEGLSAAHQAGIVHRDLKPENIFLVRRHDDRDFVKILDFGVAQMSLDGARKLTRAGCIVGTPHYMSPEQAGGERVDPRGDIYSLGIILYELICGRVPFDGENYRSILSQHLLDEPAPFELVAPWLEVPALLEQIVRRCLAKQPSQRFESMAELGAELRQFESTSLDSERKSSPGSSGPASEASEIETGTRAIARMTRPTVADTRGRGRLIAGGVALALLGALGGWLIVLASEDAGKVVPPAPSSAMAATPPEPAPESAAPHADSTPPKRVSVELVLEPSTARAYAGERELGTSPVRLELARGEVIDVSVRAEGYRAESVILDGTAAARQVRLEREVEPSPPRARTVETSTPRASGAQSRKKPRPAAGRRQPARPAKMASEFVDPWTTQR
jgi:eukaryotic-like serine/threonine-protein kinase